MHVLIIEDNLDIVANLYGYLEPLGYTLDVAHSGVAGLASAASGQFDAIVLDLSLPGMDGLEVCRRLRKENRLATPVLMLTARDTVQDKLAGCWLPFLIVTSGSELVFGTALVGTARLKRRDWSENDAAFRSISCSP